MHVVNVILAGGASRRFGEPKASHVYQGKPLYEHVKEQLLEGQTVIISHPSLLPFFKARGEQNVWLDDEEVRGCGPLAGMYTAMKKQEAEWYLVTACDMPFIRKRTAEIILSYCTEHTDAVIPLVHGRLQPLFALYHRRCLPFVHACLKENQLAIQDLLRKLQVRIVSEEELNVTSNEFCNINKRSDLPENGMI
ncbi:molybdenum cofactor guanylyltransferase [Bacillus australimaris]|uniref:Probable molybdenum cofactor guanylyltransferase n=1 Tax=Bacillus australimaris TaxID=1326968 RepID=A0ABD4QK65_9BACI|nr:molybdenum cofactor guanylyltransferase [Bacillus australimaris]KPN13651.1 molybdenum cofactor guanylyltransferase [Bacillus australimaris]MBR8690797.1 molybdenum cofactor guanylyltransferase [Bacillus australimaris]